MPRNLNDCRRLVNRLCMDKVHARECDAKRGTTTFIVLFYPSSSTSASGPMFNVVYVGRISFLLYICCIVAQRSKSQRLGRNPLHPTRTTHTVWCILDVGVDRSNLLPLSFSLGNCSDPTVPAACDENHLGHRSVKPRAMYPSQLGHDLCRLGTRIDLRFITHSLLGLASTSSLTRVVDPALLQYAYHDGKNLIEL